MNSQNSVTKSLIVEEPLKATSSYYKSAQLYLNRGWKNLKTGPGALGALCGAVATVGLPALVAGGLQVSSIGGAGLVATELLVGATVLPSFAQGVYKFGTKVLSSKYEWTSYNPADFEKFNENKGIKVENITLGLSEETKKDLIKYEKAEKRIEEKVKSHFKGDPSFSTLKIQSVTPKLNGAIEVKFEGEDSPTVMLASEMNCENEIKEMRTILLSILKENLVVWIEDNLEKISSFNGNAKNTLSNADELNALKDKSATEIMKQLETWGIISIKDVESSSADLIRFSEVHTKCTEALETATSEDRAEYEKFKKFCFTKNFNNKANVWNRLSRNEKLVRGNGKTLSGSLHAAKTMSEIKVSFHEFGLMDNDGKFTDRCLQEWYEEMKAGDGSSDTRDRANNAAEAMNEAAKASYSRMGIVRWFGRTFNYHNPLVVERSKDLKEKLIELYSGVDRKQGYLGETVVPKLANEKDETTCETAGFRKKDMFALEQDGRIKRDKNNNPILSINFMTYKLQYNRIHNAMKKGDDSLTSEIEVVHKKIKNALRGSSATMTPQQELQALETLAFAIPYDAKETYKKYAEAYSQRQKPLDELVFSKGNQSKIDDFCFEAGRLQTLIKNKVTSKAWGIFRARTVRPDII